MSRRKQKPLLRENAVNAASSASIKTRKCTLTASVEIATTQKAVKNWLLSVHTLIENFMLAASARPAILKYFIGASSKRKNEKELNSKTLSK